MSAEAADDWTRFEQLEQAVAHGDPAAVTALLGAGADPEAVEELDDPTLLMRAAEAGRLDVVRALVEGGANVNAEAEDVDLERRYGESVAEVVTGVSALLYAGLKRHADVYDYLHSRTEAKLRRRVEQMLKALNRLASSKANNRGAKALVDAAMRGDLETIGAKLAAGTNIDAQDRRGGTALLMAAALDHRQIVDFLLGAGADVNLASNEGMAPIHCAKAPEIIRALVAAGAAPNAEAQFGRRPLHFACGRSHDANQARCLVELGADVNATDENGETALIGAVQFASPEVVALLIAAGADLGVRNERGCSVFELACARVDGRPALDVLQLLREAGAAPAGVRELVIAAEDGDLAKVRQLLAAGVDVNRREAPPSDPALGQTALHAAAAAGRAEVVQALIAAGAALEAETEEFGGSKRSRLSPLRLAAAAGQCEIIRLLVASGADVEAGALGAAGMTPLMEAAQRGDAPTVAALMAAGADPRRKSWGSTAADLAAEAGHAEVAAMLDADA